MDYFSRLIVASGGSRFREKAKEAEQVNQHFKANLDNLKSRLQSPESSEVIDFLDMIYDTSFPEDQVFLKTPSRSMLTSKKELVLQLLLGLDSLGVPVMAEMLIFTKKYGPEEIADSLMILLDCFSSLLEGKELPQFSTDDVMDAMDLGWHSSSRKGSPLLDMFTSASSSPRASAPTFGKSSSSPAHRRTISDRSTFVSRAQVVVAKAAREKTLIGASMPPRSVSLAYPSADQDVHLSQSVIPEGPLATGINQFPVHNEKPSASYSLDKVPGLQRRHQRKSSSLKERFAENAYDELSGDVVAGAPAKRNSISSSWRRTSFELKRLLSNTSGTSAPRKSGGAAVDNKEEASVALEKALLPSMQSQDKDVNGSSWKGSRRDSPSPPPDKVALWRKDSRGFSADLTSSIKTADQTIDGGGSRTREEIDAGVGLASQKDVDDVYLRGNLEGYAAHTRTHAQYPGSNEDVCGSDKETEQEFSNDEVEVHRHTHDDNARHAHSSGTRDLDAGNSRIADPLQQDALHADTQDDYARHAHSLGTHDQDVGSSSTVDPDHQNESKTAYDKSISEGTSIMGDTLQRILAPFLASSNVSRDADGKDGDTATLPLKDDQGSGISGNPSCQEKEDRSSQERGDGALPAALSPHEDFQTTPKKGGVVSSIPSHWSRQVNVQYESHREEPEWSSVGDKTDAHLLLTHSQHGNSDGSKESLHSVSSVDVVALAGATRFTDSKKQSDDPNARHRVETDELLQKHPSLDASMTRIAAVAGSKSASMSFGEVCRGEILQSKDYEASMQKALPTTDDSWHKEGFTDLNRSLDEGDYFVQLDTKSVNNVSLHERVKLEKPELSGQDERENLRPLVGYIETVSEPHAVDEYPRRSAQFEKSFLGADAADGVCSDNPLVNNSELRKMRADDKILVETATGGQVDKEQMQKFITKGLSKENSEHDSMGSVVQSTDENILAKEGATMDAGARSRVEECSRSAAEEESAANGGSLTVDSVGDRDMPADFMGLSAHRENQQDAPLSKSVDPADFANLHGHPTSSSSPRLVDFPLKSDQHDRAPFSDPATETWEMHERATSKRKGARSGKLANNCLGCFNKPQTK